MKIVICGSMKLCKEMIDVRDGLLKFGHDIILPVNTEIFANANTSDHSESTKNKIDHDLLRGYFKKIANSDAVLVVNEDLNGIKGYIGGNSFLEMGFAHVLNKNIYLLNDIPEISFKDELIAMQPIILNGDFSKI